MNKYAALLPSVVFAVAACAPAATGKSYADRVAEILVRLDVVHARTVHQCQRADAQCIVAAENGVNASRRMHSDLVTLRVPPGLAIGRRDLLRALDTYGEASAALAAAAAGHGDLEACLRGVRQAKRSVDGHGAAAAWPGVAVRP